MDVNVEVDKLIYTITIPSDMSGLIQLKYANNNGIYFVPNGILRVVDSIDKLITITNLFECNYYSSTESTIKIKASSVTEGQDPPKNNVDMDTIKILIKDAIKPTTTEYLSLIEGFYTLSSTQLESFPIKKQKYTSLFIENEDLDNPLYTTDIVFTTFPEKPKWSKCNL